MIYFEAKFLSDCESVKPDNFYTSHMQCWGRCSRSKREKLEGKKAGWIPRKSKPWQDKFHEILRLEDNPFWFDALPSSPHRVVVSPHSSAGWIPLGLHGAAPPTPRRNSPEPFTCGEDGSRSLDDFTVFFMVILSFS